MSIFVDLRAAETVAGHSLFVVEATWAYCLNFNDEIKSSTQMCSTTGLPKIVLRRRRLTLSKRIWVFDLRAISTQINMLRHAFPSCLEPLMISRHYVTLNCPHIVRGLPLVGANDSQLLKCRKATVYSVSLRCAVESAANYSALFRHNYGETTWGAQIVVAISKFIFAHDLNKMRNKHVTTILYGQSAIPQRATVIRLVGAARPSASVNSSSE